MMNGNPDAQGMIMKGKMMVQQGQAAQGQALIAKGQAAMGQGMGMGKGPAVDPLKPAYVPASPGQQS